MLISTCAHSLLMKAMHMKCMPTKKPADNKAAPMDHSKMQGMDHSKMPGMSNSNTTAPAADKAAPMDHSKMPGMSNDMAMPEHGGH